MFDILKENLTRLGYRVSYFDTAEEASEYLNREIDGVTVGMGGSVTLAQMHLGESIGAHNTLFWHQQATTPEESNTLRTAAASADVYLASANGVAESGEIINIDGNSNRVSAILHGHKCVYLVVGRNKIAPDYDAAMWRARNIAAPLNAKRLDKKTPCAVKADKCYNCKSPDRICRALTVLWQAPRTNAYEIILINEDLGY